MATTERRKEQLMVKLKMNVLKPFERYKRGDVAEVTATRACGLEKIGLAEPATKAADKLIAKADKPAE